MVTELELWEVDSNVAATGRWRWFTWSYWCSVFNRRPNYTTVMRQRDFSRPEGGSNSFVLHECDDIETAQSAFKAICSLLEPLVDDCALMLSNGLLKELILPRPRAPEQLLFDLVEIIEKKVRKNTIS